MISPRRDDGPAAGRRVAVLVTAGPAGDTATLQDVAGALPPDVSLYVTRAGRHPAWPERAQPLPGPMDRGGGARLNELSDLAPRRDLVLVDGGLELPDGWWRALCGAAYEDDTFGSATALPRDPVDVRLGQPPERPVDVAPPAHRVGMTIAAAASRPPSVLWPWAHLAYLRRDALDLIGRFDESLTHLGAVLADFGARGAQHGLGCALAPIAPLALATAEVPPCPDDELRRLAKRHPWLAGAATEQATLRPGGLRRRVAVERARRHGLSVTVDARALGTGVGGTQTYISALLESLAADAAVRTRVLLAADAPATSTALLARLGLEAVDDLEVRRGVARTDVVHRPQQVFGEDDLLLLRSVGERLVITQMDLILYGTPAYHASGEHWRDHRALTRAALASADVTLFFSEHTRDQALAEDLVTRERTRIGGVGVARDAPDAPVEPLPELVDAGHPFLLVLGADLTHKNRPFAIALADELRRRHGWEGLLVLAGAHRELGSSAAAESDALRERPEMADRVLDLGPVSDAQRRWLGHAAQAHVCASSIEGFGLIPLEAAAAGRPCIYAAVTSLAETIDPAAATITPWDPAVSADAAIGLLREGPARRHHLDLLQGALERHTHASAAAAVRAAYLRALEVPYASDALLSWKAISSERAWHDLQVRTAYGQRLIDERDGLLNRAQQRGLMRVAARPALNRALLAPFALLGYDERERDEA